MSVKTNAASLKKDKGTVKLIIPATKATPAPPIATVLGPRGVNLMEFAKAFNDKSKKLVEDSQHLPAELKVEVGTPVRVVITVYEDKTFSFVLKNPPTTYYLKQGAQIEKGSSATKRDQFAGTITKAKCREIAKVKLEDFNTDDLEAATKMVIGCAASINIQVVEG